jgi:hypothetical protein
MNPSDDTHLVALTSASTTFYARVMPVFGTLIAATVTTLAWLDLFSDPIPAIGKWAMLGATVVVAVVSFGWMGRFQHVWLEGDHLLIGAPRRGVRVSLRDVRDLTETRMQKVKWVKLELTHGTSLGKTIRFIPRGHRAWLAPWSASPLVGGLRERIAEAKKSY